MSSSVYSKPVFWQAMELMRLGAPSSTSKLHRYRMKRKLGKTSKAILPGTSTPSKVKRERRSQVRGQAASCFRDGSTAPCKRRALGLALPQPRLWGTFFLCSRIYVKGDVRKDRLRLWAYQIQPWTARRKV